MDEQEPARAGHLAHHGRPASAVVIDISARAALARCFAGAVADLAESLDLSGLALDAEAARALRELDIPMMLSLPDEQLIGFLEALSAVAAVIRAVKSMPQG